MSVEWFEGRGVDEPESRFTVLPALFWFALIATALLFLQGCATAPEEKPVCAVQFLGQTPNGMSVVRMHCLSEKEFEAANK